MMEILAAGLVVVVVGALAFVAGSAIRDKAYRKGQTAARKEAKQISDLVEAQHVRQVDAAYQRGHADGREVVLDIDVSPGPKKILVERVVAPSGSVTLREWPEERLYSVQVQIPESQIFQLGPEEVARHIASSVYREFTNNAMTPRMDGKSVRVLVDMGDN